ncbi:sensor histidine kinase [Vaginella massiliensis]|uniref:sensor histidine kinase n=1 Tax=Vaginella massiliensis TaxID=1816680 RepID=UPI0037539CDF
MPNKINNIQSFWWGFIITLFYYVITFIIYFFWFNDLSKIPKHTTFLGVTYLISTVILGILIQWTTNLQRKKDLKAIAAIIPDANEIEELNFSDISEKINTITEDQSKQIDILKERENYRREFLGNISHELKTPLFSVQGYLLTLIEGGVEDEKIRDKYLNRINKSVDRLIYLVKDLDMITDFERGNLRLNWGTFNITALAQEVIDLLEIKAENKKIVIGLSPSNLQPIMVKGDMEKIQQVLINLVVNAIHYSENKSKIKIQITEIDNKVKVDVIDQGIGMKKEDMDRIFERFYRIEKSRNRNLGGSGLGLAIVKHILEAHQQKISVKSKWEEGSTFTFYLDKS